MYSNPKGFETYSTAPPPPPLQPQYAGVTPGVPVNSNSNSSYYSEAPHVSGLSLESQPRVPWSTGLCDCCSDMPNCCMTYWCPCVTFGQIAEIVDHGSTSCGASGALYTLICCLIGCPSFYSCFYRSKLRAQYRLEEDTCGACMVHCCCEPCALCQEYRELQSRGFNMEIGWRGNVEQRTRGIAMAAPAAAPPAVQSGMNR